MEFVSGVPCLAAHWKVDYRQYEVKKGCLLCVSRWVFHLPSVHEYVRGEVHCTKLLNPSWALPTPSVHCMSCPLSMSVSMKYIMCEVVAALSALLIHLVNRKIDTLGVQDHEIVCTRTGGPQGCILDPVSLSAVGAFIKFATYKVSWTDLSPKLRTWLSSSYIFWKKWVSNSLFRYQGWAFLRASWP